MYITKNFEKNSYNSVFTEKDVCDLKVYVLQRIMKQLFSFGVFDDDSDNELESKIFEQIYIYLDKCLNKYIDSSVRGTIVELIETLGVFLIDLFDEILCEYDPEEGESENPDGTEEDCGEEECEDCVEQEEEDVEHNQNEIGVINRNRTYNNFFAEEWKKPNKM